jgi:hypothetical protein
MPTTWLRPLTPCLRQVLALETSTSALKSDLALKDEELSAMRAKAAGMEAQRQLLASEVEQLKRDALVRHETSWSEEVSLGDHFGVSYVTLGAVRSVMGLRPSSLLPPSMPTPLPGTPFHPHPANLTHLM